MMLACRWGPAGGLTLRLSKGGDGIGRRTSHPRHMARPAPRKKRNHERIRASTAAPSYV
jgi:hypothetical protein